MTRRGVLAALALVSLLSHLAAIVPVRSYFFRDFGMAFYPFHAFWARELAQGRWPWWNPYIQAGAPAFPIAYPVDLLHVLWPTPEGVSWLLTLHFPLAALGAYALARELGLGRAGAFVCGSAYALGGLAVSSLNLYLFLQALAWAPIVGFTLLRASARGGRWIAAAALSVGIALTTAQEFIGQALVLAGALALVAAPAGERTRALLRVAIAVLAGAALAGVPIAVVTAVLPETVRGRGFDAQRLLQYDLHPATLLHLFVRDFFGSVTNPMELWWGHRFFAKGFPYFVTLYLGPQVLALAAAGAAAIEPRRRRVLLVLGGLALAYAMGRWTGLAGLAATLPGFSSLRYPSKAFLLVHLVLVLLAGAGADRLRQGGGWRTYRVAAASLGAVSLALAALAYGGTGLLADWMWSDPAGNPLLRVTLGRDALLSAGVALLGVAAAEAVSRGRLTAPRATVAIAAVLVADLARAGAGVNPQVAPAFFGMLPEMARERFDDLDGGRVFTYGTEFSPAFRSFVRQRVPGTLVWGYFVRRQMLVPHANVEARVELAMADDEGIFILSRPDVGPAGHDPAVVERILPHLRNAAVTRVLSLDPLQHPDLRLRAAVPAGPPGLAIHVYELRGSWPRAYVACRPVTAATAEAAQAGILAGGGGDVYLDEPAEAGCRGGTARRLRSVPGEDRYEVETDGPGLLVTRDSHAKGWRAAVDGAEARVLRANGRHRAVPVPAGRHQVTLRYAPPGLPAGLAAMAAGLLVILALWLRPILQPRSAGGAVPAPDGPRSGPPQA